MATKEKFLKGIESSLKRYKAELSKIDNSLVKYKASDKARLVSQSKKLKESLKNAETAFQELKTTSQDRFEDIKKSFLEMYDTLSDSFSDLTSHLTIDQLHHYKDEIIDYSCDKMSDAQACIKKHPLTCVGWAFGIGFILGVLLRR